MSTPGAPQCEPPTVVPPPGHAGELRSQFGRLTAGQRVRVTQRVRVGKRQWRTTVEGAVEQTTRRLTGLHTQRAGDDHVYVDALRIRLDDGEVTTITLDEFTDLEVLPDSQ